MRLVMKTQKLSVMPSRSSLGITVATHQKLQAQEVWPVALLPPDIRELFAVRTYRTV